MNTVADFLGSFGSQVTPYDNSKPPVGNFNIGPTGQNLDSILNSLTTLPEPDRTNAITALTNQINGSNAMAPTASSTPTTGNALTDAYNSVGATLSTAMQPATNAATSNWFTDWITTHAANYGLIIVGGVLIIGALLISQKEQVISLAKGALK